MKQFNGLKNISDSKVNSSPLELAYQKIGLTLPVALTDLGCISIEETLIPPASSEVKRLFKHTSQGAQLTFSKTQAQRSTLPLSVGPLRVGVCFSGGQAPGGHNVVIGLFEALKELHAGSHLWGFLKGPGGILKNEAKELTAELLGKYKNSGGFDLLGSGRTKIATQEQLAQALTTARQRDLDGLVIIGGDDSNTNAALLAEYFVEHGCKTRVIGVPKTIDGDLKNSHIEISFGFDTASKIYAEMIGNIAKDALSAQKYYHFIKLMGRSASHVTLECALQVHPNVTLISEEVAQKGITLQQIVEQIVDVISQRAELDKNYGLILIPEGLIEFIPEMKKLIEELNTLLAIDQQHSKAIEKLKRLEDKLSYLEKLSTPAAFQTLSLLPHYLQEALLMDRDPHGNVQVSHIATEQLLIHCVGKELEERKKEGKYQGTFSAVGHFFGYEGRAGSPSLFDAHYCYALGRVTALLLGRGYTGYMSLIHNLTDKVEAWRGGGIALSAMITMQWREGHLKPVINRALVDLNAKPFALLSSCREEWALEDSYVSPGPTQLLGPLEVSMELPLTLKLEQGRG